MLVKVAWFHFDNGINGILQVLVLMDILHWLLQIMVVYLQALLLPLIASSLYGKKYLFYGCSVIMNLNVYQWFFKLKVN